MYFFLNDCYKKKFLCIVVGFEYFGNFLHDNYFL